MRETPPNQATEVNAPIAPWLQFGHPRRRVTEQQRWGGITLTFMNKGFCRFPQTRSWHEAREHLAELQGVAVTDATDAPVVGSWIDFTFRGHSFTINAESGEFVFFVEDTDCPESVRAEVAAHFEPFFAERTDHGDDGDISLRRV